MMEPINPILKSMCVACPGKPAVPASGRERRRVCQDAEQDNEVSDPVNNHSHLAGRGQGGVLEEASREAHEEIGYLYQPMFQ